MKKRENNFQNSKKEENNMDIIIKTSCGDIKGIEEENSIVFKGIRYATASRFEYPKRVTKWEGIYDGTTFKHCCVQPRTFYNEEENLKKVFYYNEFRKGETYTYDEDCLFLNIWTSKNAKKWPVIIYIHGGGFTGGCGHEKHFNGPIWPQKGVIGVTINYRLGPLGFINLKKEGILGNYGLYDQYTAIQWIKENIEAFGGDANNITIMGQSAGAMSVQYHCLSPMAKGLFQKAVMCSGGGVSSMLKTAELGKNDDFWNKVMINASCNSIDELKKVDVKTYYEAWEKAKKEVKGLNLPSPVIDHKYVVGQGVDLLKTNKHHHIPYMCGSTSEDMMPPIFFSMAKSWCKKQTKDSFIYYFDRQLPGDDNGAWHSSDLWYWFGTLKNSWRPFEKKDYLLSNQMIDYLCNFAKFGNPNGANLPKWDSKKVLCFGEQETQMRNPSLLKQIKTMLTNKAVGE